MPRVVTPLRRRRGISPDRLWRAAIWAGAGAGAIGAYIGGPLADNTGYVLLFTIYGMLFLLSIAALKGVQEDRPMVEALAY